MKSSFTQSASVLAVKINGRRFIISMISLIMPGRRVWIAAETLFRHLFAGPSGRLISSFL
jgi:hypothetical protein